MPLRRPSIYSRILVRKDSLHGPRQVLPLHHTNLPDRPGDPANEFLTHVRNNLSLLDIPSYISAAFSEFLGLQQLYVLPEDANSLAKTLRRPKLE
jgi:hypothetical protein